MNGENTVSKLRSTCQTKQILESNKKEWRKILIAKLFLSIVLEPDINAV